jgi:hypothetical protein
MVVGRSLVSGLRGRRTTTKVREPPVPREPIGKADIWAWCETCERWFACPDRVDPDTPAPYCPVCGSEPQRIEDRAGARPQA